MNGDKNRPKRDRGDKAPADTGLHDGVLRDRFAMLRRQEQQHVPAFDSLWGRRALAQRGKGLWFAAATFVLIVVAVVFLLRLERPGRPAVSIASITEWKAPTDFLLETPGGEILRTVPEIGKWQEYTGTTAVGGQSQVKNKVLH